MTLIPDYVVIGHVTHDQQADGSVLSGGTALYGALAATRLGCRVGIVTAGPVAVDVAALMPDALLHCHPAEQATVFANRYRDGQRTQYLLGRAPTIDLATMPVAWWRAPVVHLGPLAGEIDPVALAGHAPRWLGATPQGWLRRWDATGLVALGPPADPVAFARASLRVLVMSEGAEATCAEPLFAPVLARGGLVVVTRGAAGSLLHQGNDIVPVGAYRVEEVDPTGAGDVFAAVLMVRLAAGDAPAAAAAYASAAGALTVTGRGLAAVPDGAAIDALMAHGMVVGP